MTTETFNLRAILNQIDLREHEDLTVDHIVLKLLTFPEVLKFLDSTGLHVDRFKHELRAQIDRNYESSLLRNFLKSFGKTENPSSLYVLLKVLSLRSWAKSYLVDHMVDHLVLLTYVESRSDVPKDVLATLEKYKSIIESEVEKDKDYDLNRTWGGGFEIYEDETDFKKLFEIENLCRLEKLVPPGNDGTGTAIAYLEQQMIDLEYVVLQKAHRRTVSITESTPYLSPAVQKSLEILILETLDNEENLPF